MRAVVLTVVTLTCSCSGGDTIVTTTGRTVVHTAGEAAAAGASGAAGAGSTTAGSTTSGAGTSTGAGSTGTSTGGEGCVPGKCYGSVPVCTHGQCVECLQDSDCASSVDLCDTSSNTCVACLYGGAPCANDDVCYPDNTCHPSCASADAGCGNNPLTGRPEVCNASTGACEQCASSADCVRGQVCARSFCSDCAADSDCVAGDAGTSCNSGTCNQCHAFAASDSACPDGGACSAEGSCCATTPELCN